MYETLKRLWDEGKLTEVKLQNAVSKGYITEEQANEIKGETIISSKKKKK